MFKSGQFKSEICLTLFRPGGGAIVPALTLDSYNVSRMQARPTKLGEFS